MNYDLQKPCKGCPFRTNAAPGWLGEYEPAEVIEHLQREIPFLCHIQIEEGPGYEDENWQDWAEENAQHCAGALIMQAKMCKLPMDEDHAEAVRNIDKSQKILFPPQAFIDYHTSKKKKRGR